ncbi:MAG: hypothetical protein R3F11_10390 [Verrucomicrobiales bacterium]
MPETPGDLGISWTGAGAADLPGAAIFQTGRVVYSADATRILADLAIVLNSSLADLPGEARFPMPAGARVLSAEGEAVSGWTLDGDAAVVRFAPGKRRQAAIRLLAEVPAIADAEAEARAELPLPQADIALRASGKMVLAAEEGVRVKEIEPGAYAAYAPPGDDDRSTPGFVAAFEFAAAGDAPAIALERTQPRFAAACDNRIELRRDAVYLTRTITLVPEEGELFTLKTGLPAGEEILSVRDADGSEPEWSRTNGAVAIRLSSGLGVGASAVFTIASRMDPADWFGLGEEPRRLDFQGATVEGAERLSGYVAVDYAESFRVRTAEAAGLEVRDVRAAPVAGQLAWFRLADFSLALEVSRRAAEIEATVAAYALPLVNTLEIEGQLDLAIRYSGIQKLTVALPAAAAEHLHFDSPLIAERSLDEAAGAWTLTFHDEIAGFQVLPFRLSLPFAEGSTDPAPAAEEGDADSAERRFRADVPPFAIAEAKRISGTWWVEANTDTEVSFEAEGLDEVDALSAQGLPGYAPRHRVIAAYRYRGSDYSLGISGVRHRPIGLPATIIDRMRIDSVLSGTDAARHRALFGARTNGDQFLEVALPEQAQILVVAVDGYAVKPVRSSGGGDLRIALPPRAAGETVQIKLVFETRADRWGGSGDITVQPIQVSNAIPVLQSNWFLHLPEGYSYRGFDGNLHEEFEETTRVLLGHVGDRISEFELPIYNLIQSDSYAPAGAETKYFGDGFDLTDNAFEENAEEMMPSDSPEFASRRTTNEPAPDTASPLNQPSGIAGERNCPAPARATSRR